MLRAEELNASPLPIFGHAMGLGVQDLGVHTKYKKGRKSVESRKECNRKEAFTPAKEEWRGKTVFHV